MVLPPAIALLATLEVSEGEASLKSSFKTYFKNRSNCINNNCSCCALASDYVLCMLLTTAHGQLAKPSTSTNYVFSLLATIIQLHVPMFG